MPKVHRFGDKDSDDDTAVEGSPDVFANNLKVHRVGDKDSDDDTAVEGSPDVFANEATSSLFPANPEPAIVPSPAQLAGFAYNNAHREQYDTPAAREEQTGSSPEFPPQDPLPPPAPFGDCVGGPMNVPETPTEHPDIVNMLSIILSEAGSGQWRESGKNQNILSLYRDVGAPQAVDTVHWCAAFVGAILKRTCHKFLKGNLAARAFASYGAPVSGGLANAKRGDIVVFTRDGGGHVAFFWGMGPSGQVQIVGGNQSNSVTLKNHPISRLLPNGVQRPIDVNP